MSRFLLGVVAGAGLAYMCNKKMNKETMDRFYDSANEFVDKAKRTVKDVLDKGKNEAEYAKDRVENKFNSADNQING